MSKDVDIKDLVKRHGLWYEKFTNEPFTGKTTGRIQNNYKNGKLNGESCEYYENGQLMNKKNYKDGELDGEQTTHYENGQVRIKSNFKDGKDEGKKLFYDEYGSIELTEIYKDDKLIEATQWINGIQEKELRHYYENGIVEIKKYKDGELIETEETRY
jgi:hypothetical protein